MTERSYPPLRPQAGAPRRRATPWALVIGVVLLAILATVLAVVLLTRDGDGGTGIGSPSATPSASASGSPAATPSAGSLEASASPSTTAPAASAGPTPVVAAPTGILPAGSVVQVAAEGLRIREEPSTSSAVLGTVAAGEVLYLVSNPSALGPIEAGGFDWYLVTHADGWSGWPANPPGSGDGPSGDPRVSGWVAAGSGSDAFVTLAPVDCPEGTVDIHTIYALTAWARLACFGDRQLTFEGTYGCGGCGGLAHGTFTPEWLIHPINFNLLRPPYAESVGVSELLVLRDPPDGPALNEVEAGSVLRVTGHFNDPLSADCVAPGEAGSEQPADETAAEYLCREQFVIESWEVIGTDPDFQGS